MSANSAWPFTLSLSAQIWVRFQRAEQLLSKYQNSSRSGRPLSVSLSVRLNLHIEKLIPIPVTT